MAKPQVHEEVQMTTEDVVNLVKGFGLMHEMSVDFTISKFPHNRWGAYMVVIPLHNGPMDWPFRMTFGSMDMQLLILNAILELENRVDAWSAEGNWSKSIGLGD